MGYEEFITCLSLFSPKRVLDYSEDCFQKKISCDFGESSFKEAFPICNRYAPFVMSIPPPFFVSSFAKDHIVRILNEARRLDASPSDLDIVFQNANTRATSEDRLARVRTYLIFLDVARVNELLADSKFRKKFGWKLPTISKDFGEFTSRVLGALKGEAGLLEVAVAEKISDEIGGPLSGDYQELGNLMRVSAVHGDEFLGDWIRYVSIHEAYHWFQFRRNGRVRDEFQTKVAKEFKASRVGMNALVVSLKGKPLEFEKIKSEPHYLNSIDQKIEALPASLKVPFQTLWKRISVFAKEKYTSEYIQVVYEASRFELEHGSKDINLEMQALRSLERRLKAIEVIQDFQKLLDRTLKSGVDLEQVTCDPMLPPEGGSPIILVSQCESNLKYALLLANQGQMTAAFHILDNLFSDIQRESAIRRVAMGTP